MLAWLLLLWTAAPGAAATGGFPEELWNENLDVYEEILSHPFLRELASGELDREAFRFYMIQDAHYLREFARALNVTASKAPRDDWAAVLATHAAASLQYERQLHESIFAEYGISPAEVEGFEPAPEAFAYTSYLVATAYNRPFSESLAALLPCYWIYWEVGKELQKKGSASRAYQKWIETYSSPEYGESVEAVIEMTAEVARSAPSGELDRMRENFRRSARFEWMFWDSAYHRRSWPPPLDDGK